MNPAQASPEHEFEAEYGLPEPLPAGERLLWQGAPDWRLLARDAAHWRALALYFAALLVLRGATVLSHGEGWLEAGRAMLWLLPLAALALGLVVLLAGLAARASVYTITDRRVVMRIGVVLSVTFNLPFARIRSASLLERSDGSGDICLELDAADQIAYVHLWPHARPWRLKRTEPMLRALPAVRPVAALLAKALADSAGQSRIALAAAASVQRPAGARQPLAA